MPEAGAGHVMRPRLPPEGVIRIQTTIPIKQLFVCGRNYQLSVVSWRVIQGNPCLVQPTFLWHTHSYEGLRPPDPRGSHASADGSPTVHRVSLPSLWSRSLLTSPQFGCCGFGSAPPRRPPFPLSGGWKLSGDDHGRLGL